MNKRGKVRGKKYCFAAICCLILHFITFSTQAQIKNSDHHLQAKHIRMKAVVPIKKDTFPWSKPVFITTKPVKPTFLQGDSLFAFWVKNLRPRGPQYLLKNWGDSASVMAQYISTDTLDAPIAYTAEDSAVLLIPTKELYLYGKAKVKHQDVEITANVIHYNQSDNLIMAYGGTDTANNPMNKPTITQGQSKSIMDTIWFNPKTQKGLTKNTFYNEGEIFVHAEVAKKISKNETFIYDGRMTTCNLDEPHFDFRAKKMKMITGKLAVSGPAWPEFEGVPMPVVIPFGIYPMVRGRHSGFLPPTFANNGSSGLGLEGLGYYHVFNDYWDLTTRGNIYTYGGYQVTFNPRYFMRYHYNGNFNLSIQHTKLLNSSGTLANEFTVSNGFQVLWSHSMDSKARPGISFSASVSAGSTRYNQYVTNNAVQNFTNSLNSSITFGKTWGEGKYNLSIAANHNQNSNTRIINVQLPTVNFSMNTINPFAKKEIVGTQKWYEKLGVSYSGTLLNQFAFYDTAISTKRLLDTATYGMTHSIPITLTLPALGPLLFAPSVSYNENWYSRKMLRSWDSTKLRVDTTIQRGLFAARQMSFGMAMNTAIYGNFNFGKNSNIIAIHHVIRPTISANYTPNMQRGNYQYIQYDTSGYKRWVNKYEGNIVGAFSQGSYGGLSFGFDNQLEMKVKNTKDTTGKEENATKKVKLIDGLSITSGYNFLADSLRWQPINMSFRTTLFEKMNISANAAFDPYAIDSASGQRYNHLLWGDKKIGRFTGGSISMSSSFQSKQKDDKKSTQNNTDNSGYQLSTDEQQRELDYIRSNPAEFVDFNIPWNITTSLAVNFTTLTRSNYRTYTTISSSLNVNGDFSLTPRWKMGGNMMYDIRAQKIQMLTMFITREMHCWQMAINITPIGIYKSFSIVINPKSGLLRDLKINRSRYFYNQ